MGNQLPALSNKHKTFVETYMETMCQTRAAIAAGYSEARAYTTGSDLMKREDIQAYLQARFEERRGKSLVDVSMVVNKLVQVISCDYTKWADLGKKGLTKKDFQSIPEYIRTMVESFERTDYKNHLGEITHSRFKFKLMSKTKCIELLGKHAGAFHEHLHVTGNVNHAVSFTDLVANTEAMKTVNG